MRLARGAMEGLPLDRCVTLNYAVRVQGRKSRMIRCASPGFVKK